MQAWKRSYSARLPQVFKLTTSKPKQFCETSSSSAQGNVKNEAILRDNSKNEAILRDFLRTWKVECRADGLAPTRFAIFPIYGSTVLRQPRKIDARSYEVLHLSCKIIFPKLKIWCSKMQPLSGNQRPDLLTCLINMSLVLRLPRELHLCRSSANVPEILQNSHVLLIFGQGAESPAPAPATQNHIWTFKTWSYDWVFLTLWLQKMCFALQRRALFRHLNFQKWPGPGVLCTFWLRNVLRATTARIFSTSQLPKVLRTHQFFTLLNSKCASHHNGVHFFDISTSKSGPTLVCFVQFDLEICFVPHRRATLIFHLTTWLRTHRFSEPTFRPSGATNHFATFSRPCIFCLLTLSLPWCSFVVSSLLWLFPPLLFICPRSRKFDF